MTKPKSKINIKENQIIFWLSTKNYPLEAIYSTASVFIDRCYVYLDGDPKKQINVSIKGKEKLAKKQLEVLQGEFLNELLNYLLRVEIGKRNKTIRELIVSSALVSGLDDNNFLSAVRGESDTKNENWQNDPLGIAVTWEEKYSENKKKAKNKNKRKKKANK